MRLEFFRQMRFEGPEAYHRRLQGRWLIMDLLFNRLSCPDGPLNVGYVSRSKEF